MIDEWSIWVLRQWSQSENIGPPPSFLEWWFLYGHEQSLKREIGIRRSIVLGGLLTSLHTDTGNWR